MSDSTGRLDVLIVRLAEELGDGDSGPYRSWLEARFPISRRAATPGRRKTKHTSINQIKQTTIPRTEVQLLQLQHNLGHRLQTGIHLQLGNYSPYSIGRLNRYLWK